MSAGRPTHRPPLAMYRPPPGCHILPSAAADEAWGTHDLGSETGIKGSVTQQSMKLYGEHYEIVADPLPDGDGVALQVKAKEGADVRTLRLPATILQSILGQSVKKAS